MFIGCKEKNYSDPTFDDKKCKMLTMSIKYNGGTTKFNYFYDVSNKLITKTETTFSGDTTIVTTEYKYENDTLRYSFTSSLEQPSDTFYYFYNSSHMLTKTIEFHHSFPTSYIEETEFIFNGDNHVIKTYTRKIASKSISVDSGRYQYSNGNLIDIMLWNLGSHPMVINYREFSYDNGKNMYNSTGEPQISFKYWSKNNAIHYLADFGSQWFSFNNTIGQYNSTGYPLLISERVEDNNSTYTLEYQCE